MGNNSGNNNGGGKAGLVRMRPSELGLPEEPTADPHRVGAALLEAAQRGCNVLAPTTLIDFVPPDHMLSIRVVQFPVEGMQGATSNGTWYKTDGGKYALHRSALDMLAAAAGISTVSSIVSSPERFYWRATNTIRMKTFEGTWRTIVASREVDLRDGSADAKKLLDGNNGAKALQNARIHGPQVCETKARNRAIRAAIGIKGAYSPDEAERPFVFPALTWKPDVSDPEVKRMVAATELGIVEQVYGRRDQGQGPVLAAPDNTIDMLVHDGGDDDEPVTTARPAQQQRAAQETRRIAETVDATSETRERERAPVQSTGGATQGQGQAKGDGWGAQPQGTPECADCGKGLSDNVASYSIDTYGRPLCYDDQKAEKAKRTGGGS
jgi:hypothetical protein